MRAHLWKAALAALRVAGVALWAAHFVVSPPVLTPANAKVFLLNDLRDELEAEPASPHSAEAVRVFEIADYKQVEPTFPDFPKLFIGKFDVEKGGTRVEIPSVVGPYEPRTNEGVLHFNWEIGRRHAIAREMGGPVALHKSWASADIPHSHLESVCTGNYGLFPGCVHYPTQMVVNRRKEGPSGGSLVASAVERCLGGFCGFVQHSFGVVGRDFSRGQSFRDQIDASASEYSGKPRRNGYPKPPQGHFLLGMQVLAGGLFAIMGCYLLLEAREQVGSRSTFAGLGYFLGGLLSLALCVFFVVVINIILF
ncbi:MAG: hypothetical protein WDZ83_17325 [Rhizobiaceae bacterium]